MTQQQKDYKYIDQCLRLAKRGIGKVNPNPLVGSVIVKDEKVISKGWHEYYGGAHAELNAIRNAKENLKGATLYCNLEPCCHTDKQTPPCTLSIISSGIKKVIISNIDPNPKVAGKGVEQLRNSGIEVEFGIMEEEGKELNKFFFHHIKTGLPFVTVKIAQTLDGKISSSKGKQKWITGEESKIYVHQLRASHDAILVGANTVKIDDPLLNVRLTKGRDPKIIVIDGKLSIPLDKQILSKSDLSDIYYFTGKNISKNKLKILESKNAIIVQLAKNKKGEISLSQILKILGKEKINSILVEGGNQIYSQFLKKELFNELINISAPKIFGSGLDSFAINKKINLKLKSFYPLGDDLVSIYQKKSDIFL